MDRKRFKPMDGTGANPVATVLRVVATVIFICGFVAGISLGTQEADVGRYYSSIETVFVWSTAIAVWATAIFTGIVMLGFAEIITLLQQIQSQDYVEI